MAYGVKSVTIDGLAMDVTSEPNASIARKTFAEIEVVCGTPDVSVKRKMASVEIECLIPKGKKVSDFQGKSDVLVQIETEDGRTFFWDEATETSESSDLKLVDGKMTLKYLSTNCGEL